MKISFTFDISDYWRNVIAYHLSLEKKASYNNLESFIPSLVWNGLDSIANDYDQHMNEIGNVDNATQETPHSA